MPSTNNVVPASSDVTRETSGDEPAAGHASRGYEYVTRRSESAVAVAEARGIDPAVARATADHLADALDACITPAARREMALSGAARLVLQLADDGEIAGARLKMDPGTTPAAARTAVLCLVAPAKMIVFPPVDGGARGIAIEAVWGTEANH